MPKKTKLCSMLLPTLDRNECLQNMAINLSKRFKNEKLLCIL